ncbi:hypothetical protein V6N13_054342 [Hibiscus sabdariffa]
MPYIRNPVNGSLRSSTVVLESHGSRPPQPSKNSDSSPSQSPSSSSGEAQILEWLSHSPTDIESYIRPGCVILTIYLRLGESAWEELCCDLDSSLRRLVDVSDDSFWKTGWVYVRVRHSVAFIFNGRVVLGGPLPLKSNTNCRIASIIPIVVSVTERAHLLLKALTLVDPAQGKYRVQETCYDLMEVVDPINEQDKLQNLCFPCSIPNVCAAVVWLKTLDSAAPFSLFIVAEQDLCSEICTLESVIEIAAPTVDINKNEEKMET